MYDTTASDYAHKATAGINPWCIQPDTCKILASNTPYCCDKCSRRDKAGEDNDNRGQNPTT